MDQDGRGFVDDVEAAARVSSDLHFAIYRELRAAGILQPPPPASITVHGLGKVFTAELHGRKRWCRDNCTGVFAGEPIWDWTAFRPDPLRRARTRASVAG